MSYASNRALPFKHATWMQLDPHTTVEIEPFYPLLVVFEGKPSSGKTTYAQMLSEKLNGIGVKALDSKRYLHEKTSLGHFLDYISESFGEGNNPFASSAISMMHAFSYASELSLMFSNKSNYHVLIMQRMPEDFAFALGTFMHMQSGLNRMAGGVSALSKKLINPDLIVFLRADDKTLSERAASRNDGKDRAHKILLASNDDALFRVMKARGNHLLEIDTSKKSAKENTEKIFTMVISLLRQDDKP